jgi:serine/threonine-protein kinase
VVKQVPAAGASATPGSAVTVTLGPKNTPAGKVPGVINLSAVAAKQAIEAAGLKYLAAGPEPAKVTGYVVKQAPAAGAPAAPGGAVTVELAAAPANAVKVPDLVGTPHDVAKAKSEVEAAKLVFKPADPLAVKGAVAKQDPTAGKSVAPGSVVTVTFGKPTAAVKVPDLAGAAYAKAKAQAEQIGLVLKPADPTRLGGVVVKQDPPAGQSAAAGAAVTVTFGDTKPADGGKVAVPNVAGMGPAQAKQALQAAKLDPHPGAAPPAGSVVTKQDPAAGQSVPAGSPVTLSFGPGKSGGAGGATAGGGNPPARVAVPDVSGMTAAQARQALESARLRYQASGPTAGPARWQSPAAGAQVPPETAVSVAFAAPKPAQPPMPQQVRVPDVRGREFGSAQKALGDAGLTAQATGDTKSPHRVDTQTPTPGAMADRGAVVRLSMSK